MLRGNPCGFQKSLFLHPYNFSGRYEDVESDVMVFHILNTNLHLQIGRAGRLGHRGTAITFMNNNNKRLFLNMVERVKPTGSQLPPQLLNSPHLLDQRRRAKISHKGKGNNVTNSNIIDIIKRHDRNHFKK